MQDADINCFLSVWYSLSALAENAVPCRDFDTHKRMIEITIFGKAHNFSGAAFMNYS
tara:strand:+ start:2405 stop:2575 length:171 start_codon:yes stop_codon:yes gene_type:complete